MYVFGPEHTGSALTAGPVGVITAPQEFVTLGGVGTTCALLIHDTVEEPGAGNENVGGEMLYVKTHVEGLPVQSV